MLFHLGTNHAEYHQRELHREAELPEHGRADAAYGATNDDRACDATHPAPTDAEASDGAPVGSRADTRSATKRLVDAFALRRDLSTHLLHVGLVLCVLPKRGGRGDGKRHCLN